MTRLWPDARPAAAVVSSDVEDLDAKRDIAVPFVLDFGTRAWAGFDDGLAEYDRGG